MRTLQLVDTALCYVAGSRAKPLLGRLLHGLYEGGASLHSVWGNADEHLKTCDGGDEPLPDAAEQRSVSEMGEAVRENGVAMIGGMDAVVIELWQA